MEGPRAVDATGGAGKQEEEIRLYDKIHKNCGIFLAVLRSFLTPDDLLWTPVRPIDIHLTSQAKRSSHITLLFIRFARRPAVEGGTGCRSFRR